MKARRGKNNPKRSWPIFVVLGLVAIFTLFCGWKFYQNRMEQKALEEQERYHRDRLVFYETHFLPGTIFDGTDCSDFTLEQVEALYPTDCGDYVLTIAGRDGEAQISGSSVNLHREYEISAADILAAQDRETYQTAAETPREYTSTESWHCDDDLLMQQLQKIEFFANQEESEDAFVAYSEASGQYELNFAVPGNAVDLRQVAKAARRLMLARESVLDLEKERMYAEYVREDTDMEALVNQLNRALKVTITFTVEGNRHVMDASLIRKAIDFDDKYNMIVNTSAYESWIASLAGQYDTVGKTRTFRSAEGYNVSLGGGTFGWQMNRSKMTAAVKDALLTGKSLAQEASWSRTAFGRGAAEFGNLYVEVNQTSQMVYVVKNGSVAYSTPCVTGCVKNRTMTPNGVHYIMVKMPGKYLVGADYRTWVDYWMRFTQSACGLHDLSRSAYGGDIYITNGSHGCVNLSRSAAATIYDMISVGTPVLVYGGVKTYTGPVEPPSTEPVSTELSTSEPATSEPAATEPATSEPATSEPATTEPVSTEPSTSEPATTEPATSEPVPTEPAPTEPAPSESESGESATGE